MLTYGIDWDDVISDLNTHAIQLANGEHGLDLKLEDINSWENVGKASVIKQYYQDERIYRMQTVTEMCIRDRLNATAKELGKNESLRRELIANVSHDLRTPLTMIIAYAEVMRDLPGENTPENVQVVIDEACLLYTSSDKRHI